MTHQNEWLWDEKHDETGFRAFWPKFTPIWAQKPLFLGPNGPKIKIMQIVSYDQSFFMFRARKSRKKYFQVILTKSGPILDPKRVKKGEFWSKFSKKKFFTNLLFFWIERFWVEKRSKNGEKNFSCVKWSDS